MLLVDDADDEELQVVEAPSPSLASSHLHFVAVAIDTMATLTSGANLTSAAETSAHVRSGYFSRLLLSPK